jgi:hypothetical protein
MLLPAVRHPQSVEGISDGVRWGQSGRLEWSQLLPLGTRSGHSHHGRFSASAFSAKQNTRCHSSDTTMANAGRKSFGHAGNCAWSCA